MKFRFWDLDRKNHSLFSLVDRKNSMIPLFDEFVNENLIIQQFTGQRDRNNKEIYVGDIVTLFNWDKKSFGNFPVTFSEERSSFWFTLNNELFRGLFEWRGEKEIVGNIFENPDLIKVFVDKDDKKLKSSVYL